MNRRDLTWLACLGLAFLIWHVPLMYRTASGQDEHWFGVAGITVLRTGLPRIPYLPSRDPRTICYEADVALYVLPPLSFYLQGLVHAVAGEGIGQARLTSALLGLGAVGLVYGLARCWFEDRRGALLAATAYTFSRAFYFPATTARPDMAATMFGLLAIWWAVRHRRAPSRRLACAAGAAAGLSLLAHPFGVVPAVQSGLGILAVPGPVRGRLGDALAYGGTALAAFALWVPLIALHPDLFRIQFGGNVLFRAGPGLGETLRAPLATLAYQAQQVWGHVQPVQAILYAAGLAWGVARGWRSEGGRGFLYHLAAGILLLVLLQGRHPTLGYYSYPAALASVAVGMLMSEAAGRLERLGGSCQPRRRVAMTGLAVCLILLAMLPGAGLRTLVAHARHWRDPGYDARPFVRAVLADLPPGRLVAVDSPFALNFYLADRRVVSTTVLPPFFDARREPFEYALFGRPGLTHDRPQMTDLTLIRTYGDPDDPFACYAELYRRMPSTTPWGHSSERTRLDAEGFGVRREPAGGTGGLSTSGH